jgi:hypothetical protein
VVLAVIIALSLVISVGAAEDKNVQNLVSNVAYNFEGDINKVLNSGWHSFSGATLEVVDDGYEGKCMKATNFIYTWSTPTFDLFPLVRDNGIGTYSISLMLKFDTDEDYETNMIVRGTRENSFIRKSGSNHFIGIGGLDIKANEWIRVICTFTVEEGDIATDDMWRFCISSIPQGTRAVYVDNFIMIKGKLSQLPNEIKISQSDAAEGENQVREEDFYDPRIKSAMIKTAIFTAITVAVVIPLKIYGKSLFGKIKMRKDNEK